MSALTTSGYKAKYGSTGIRFPDNTTGLITEGIMREFGEDNGDSFINQYSDLQLMSVASGTDTYTVSGSITSYATKFTILVKFTNANTGAATLNVNSLGAKAIKKTGSVAMASGDISAGQILLLVYDGTNFQVVGGSGGGGGGGSVTSVDMSVPTSLLTLTGNPITGAGTLAVDLATQSANKVFAGPTTGADATPTFRSLVIADIPSLSSLYAPVTSGTSILKGNGSGGFSNAVSGTDYAPATSGTSILKGNGSGGFSNASAGTDYESPLTFSSPLSRSTNTISLGTVPIAKGGTNATSYTTGSIPYFNGTSLTEDNSNLFYDGTNHRLGLGTTSPGTRLTVTDQSSFQTAVSGSTAQFVGTDANPLRITFDTHNNSSASGGAFMIRRSRGTAASPSALSSADVLGSINFRGYGTSQYAASSTALISAIANQAFTNTANGTYLAFSTTPDNSVTAAEVFRFGAAGQFGIGGANYGTSGNTIISGGSGAAPSWGQYAQSNLSGLGTGVSTWLGTPSWTNFLSAITGTAPYWALTGTSTLTGTATIASNTASQHLFNGTWTASANNQYHASFAPTLTNTGTSSHVIGIVDIAGTLNTGGNTQVLAALNIHPTFSNTGSFTTPTNAYIRCFDGTTQRFLATDNGVTIASSNNNIAITNPVGGPKIEGNTATFVLSNASSSGAFSFQVNNTAYAQILGQNSVGFAISAVGGSTTSTATQKSSQKLTWIDQEYNGTTSLNNYWNAMVTVSTATNGLSTWDLFTGTTGSQPSLGNLHLRIRSSDGAVLIGAGSSTTMQPSAKLTINAGSATANTAPLKLTSGTLNTTAEAGAYEFNDQHYATKTSGLRYAMGGVIADFTTDANNSGTSETDLYSYTTPASTLASTGEKITFDYNIILNDVTATAQIKVLFAGTTIGDTGALTVSATGAVVVRGYIIRTGSTTARASVNISSPTASTAVYTKETDLTGLTFTNTNILKVTGTAGGAGGGSNDITGKLGMIMWFGTANN